MSKGYLKEIFGRKKERSREKEQDPTKILEKPRFLPSDFKVINVISGGSDIFGTS